MKCYISDPEIEMHSIIDKHIYVSSQILKIVLIAYYHKSRRNSAYCAMIQIPQIN